MKGSPHPKATMFKLTSKLSKETGHLNQLNRARRSRSVSTTISVFCHSPSTVSERLFLLCRRDFWQRRNDCQGPFNSRHGMSKAMHFNTTFASSQSCRKGDILSPSPYNPMTCNASLHTWPSREPLEDAFSSSDQASPALSHLGLSGQPIFHSSPKPGT